MTVDTSIIDHDFEQHFHKHYVELIGGKTAAPQGPLLDPLYVTRITLMMITTLLFLKKLEVQVVDLVLSILKINS